MYFSSLFNLLTLVGLFIAAKVANSQYICKDLEKNDICSVFGLKSAIPPSSSKSPLLPLTALEDLCPTRLEVNEFTALSCYISASACYKSGLKIPQGANLVEFTQFVHDNSFEKLAEKVEDPNARNLCKQTCESVVQQMKDCNKIFKFKYPNSISLCYYLPSQNCIDGAAIKAAFSAKQINEKNASFQFKPNRRHYTSAAFCLIFWAML